MTEWKEYKLGEIIQIIGGGTPKTSVPEYWDGDIPWLSVSDFNNGKKYVFTTEKHITQLGLNNSSTKLLHKDDIIISARGTVGVVAMIGSDMAFNQSCYGIRNKDLVDKQYLYYLLVNSVNGLKQNAYGGVFDTITRETFDLIDVSLPSLDEQRRISAILSSLDDKIDLLHRENATLEQMAETLFRQWFVVGAKEEWEEGTIVDLVEFNPTRKLVKGTVAPFLEMSNLSTSTYSPTYWYDRAYNSGSKFENGDTLLARITPCLENGKTAYVDFLCDNQVGWGSTEFIVMHSKLGLHPFFTYVIAKYQDFRDFAESCMSGSSGRQRVDVDNLKQYSIAVPDQSTVELFNNRIENIVSKMHNNNNQIRTLIETRDGLLPRLMGGEVII